MHQENVSTLSQMTNFRLFKLKVFADDNFELHQNSRKFSKRVENTVGKEEIARFEQFLIFPQCFQKTHTADIWNPGLVWVRVKTIPNDQILDSTKLMAFAEKQNKCSWN